MEKTSIKLFIRKTTVLIFLCATTLSARAQILDGGARHSIIICEDSTVWTCGDSNYGQLGNGTQTLVGIPVQITSLSAAVAGSAGYWHTMAAMADGTVWTWGYNDDTRLGYSTASDTNTTPQQVPGITGITSVAAGGNFSMALVTSDSSIWGWGDNFYGQLGDSTSGSTDNPPVKVANLTGIVQISTGYDHTLALDKNGNVWAWGENSYGKLGDSSGTLRKYPVPVYGLTNVIKVYASKDNSIAVKDDGTVWAWGWNMFGQLGNGTFQNSNIPKQITSLSNVIDAVIGEWHASALLSDGTVWGWGRNINGQVGDGTNNDTSIPVQVSNLTTAISLFGGDMETFAILSDSTIWGWGANNYRKLGIGEFPPLSNIPKKMAISCNVVAPCNNPVASFGYITTGLGASFSDSSTSTGSWMWDFGDGNTDSIQNPSYTYANEGNYNVCLTATNPCGSNTTCQSVTISFTGVADSDIKNTIAVYPNPNTGVFTLEIQVEEMQDIDVRITNVIGQEVLSEKLTQIKGAYQKEIDLKGYSPGVYTLQLVTSKGIVDKRIIIE